MPKLILDQFTSMPVSRQLRYKLRRREKGLCPQCGRLKEPGCTTYTCARCNTINTERVQAQRKDSDSILSMI